MIPSRQEIAYRTYGAWLLARFDAGGARYFDESPLGALRSSFAAALVAPAYFIGKLLSISGVGLQSDAAPFIVALVFALGCPMMSALNRDGMGGRVSVRVDLGGS